MDHQACALLETTGVVSRDQAFDSISVYNINPLVVIHALVVNDALLRYDVICYHSTRRESYRLEHSKKSPRGGQLPDERKNV